MGEDEDGRCVSGKCQTFLSALHFARSNPGFGRSNKVSWHGAAIGMVAISLPSTVLLRASQSAEEGHPLSPGMERHLRVAAPLTNIRFDRRNARAARETRIRNMAYNELKWQWPVWRTIRRHCSLLTQKIIQAVRLLINRKSIYASIWHQTGNLILRISSLGFPCLFSRRSFPQLFPPPTTVCLALRDLQMISFKFFFRSPKNKLNVNKVQLHM